MDAERAVSSNCGRSNLEARLRHEWIGERESVEKFEEIRSRIEGRGRPKKGEAFDEEIGGKILVDWEGSGWFPKRGRWLQFLETPSLRWDRNESPGIHRGGLPTAGKYLLPLLVYIDESLSFVSSSFVRFPRSDVWRPLKHREIEIEIYDTRRRCSPRFADLRRSA